MTNHPTPKCLHSLVAHLYGIHKIAESGISSTLGCSVDSSRCAGLLFGPLQSIDGNHLHSPHSHQVAYLVTICVVGHFAPIQPLMQIPAAAHSIATTSECLQYGL